MVPLKISALRCRLQTVLWEQARLKQLTQCSILLVHLLLSYMYQLRVFRDTSRSYSERKCSGLQKHVSRTVKWYMIPLTLQPPPTKLFPDTAAHFTFNKQAANDYSQTMPGGKSEDN